MRYVTRIGSGVEWDTGVAKKGVPITICDSDTGALDRDLSHDCIGFFRDGDIAVQHTLREVMLYQFIESAESIKLEDADGSRYYRSIDSYLDEPDEGIQLICFPDEVFHFYGENGSVVRIVHLTQGLRATYCTMYDFLGYVCSQAGEYMMDKDALVIDSGSIHMRSVIKFKQTPEAQRFLTKLYLIAMGG